MLSLLLSKEVYHEQHNQSFINRVLNTRVTGRSRPTEPAPMDMTTAIQNTKTKADHEALATHYEQAAHDAEAKVEEHKKSWISTKRTAICMADRLQWWKNIVSL